MLNVFRFGVLLTVFVVSTPVAMAGEHVCQHPVTLLGATEYLKKGRALTEQALNGDQEAQVELGRLFLLPDISNPAEARKWFTMAAQQENGKAFDLLPRLSSFRC